MSKKKKKELVRRCLMPGCSNLATTTLHIGGYCSDKCKRFGDTIYESLGSSDKGQSYE